MGRSVMTFPHCVELSKLRCLETLLQGVGGLKHTRHVTMANCGIGTSLKFQHVVYLLLPGRRGTGNNPFFYKPEVFFGGGFFFGFFLTPHTHVRNKTISDLIIVFAVDCKDQYRLFNP